MEGFGGAPRFLAYPRAFTVQSGTDAVLSCQITGDPQPSILWEKDKTPIEPSGRFHVEAKGDLYSLLVSHATPQDSGLYICKAKNSVGETYAAATLKVEAGEPQEEERCPGSEAPSFLVAPSSTQVCRGEDVMFACRVSGQPCPVLEWEKDGHKLSDLFETSHFAVGQEPEDWHFLKLFGARPPDGGVYVCRARSGSREALAAAVLLVESRAPLDGLPNGSADGPEPLSERVPGAKAFAVSVGKHAKFRCYVTGKPKPEIIWQKDGEPLAPGRRHLIYEDREGYFILKVLYCKPQDQGLYICTASNTAGQTLSAVQLQVKEHRLRFQVQLADVEVVEREDAVLECQVPLETIPTAWYLEDRELQPSHKYVMEERGVVRRLTIRDARTDDDGIYLCQMKDKGRSIAEVSVRGMIMKRLPRKLDVMEGENAVFCVETREAAEGTCWSRDGLQLRESHRTVLKSFGRTHLLVLVHVTRQDAGIISFTVGESQTSSQLRVKCVKRDPPSTPVAAEMSVAESNAALLAWCPAPDAHLRPPSRYLLERREAAGGEWVQCLATDLPGRVRVLGDSVPREADYCFRVCAANEHGRSSPVEFPGSVHLAPAARLERGLQDVRVQDGEDAWFSLELSAVVNGTWFLDGTKLGEEEEACGRCSVRHHGMEHSLLIRGARVADSGAQVTFVSGEVRDSATLHVQGEQGARPGVLLREEQQGLSSGLPVLLECHVSPPGAPVRWLKDGEAVPLDDVIAVQAEGCVRRLLLRSAGPLDTGMYTCDAGDDAVSFVVTVTEAPVRIISSNEEAPHTYVAGQRVELWCQLSRPAAPVHWYKDGEEVEADKSLVLEQEGPRHRLVLPCARPQDTGEFVCDAGGDSVFYTVTVAGGCDAGGLAVSLLVGLSLVVQGVTPCHPRTLLCFPAAAERWGPFAAGDGAGDRAVLPIEAGTSPPSSLRCHSTSPAALHPTLSLAEAPVRIVSSNEEAPHTYVAGQRVELWCQLSRPAAPVHWYKDGEEVEADKSLVLEQEGLWHRLVLPCARPQDTGEFVCDAGGDSAFYTVTVAVAGWILHPAQRSLELPVQVPGRVELRCELSIPDAPVRWFKDGLEVDETDNLLLLAEGPWRCLLIPRSSAEDAGEYICESKDEAVSFDVKVSEPPVRILQPCRPLPVVTVSPGETVTLDCELSRADAPVFWAKEGIRLEAGGSLVLEEEGAHRRLVIPTARAEHSGKYICTTADDIMTFTVQVSEPPVTIVGSTGTVEHHCVVAGEDLVLACELSRPDATVRWLRDGQEVQPGERVQGPTRSLTIKQAELGDGGIFLCDAGDDEVHFILHVKEAQVLFMRKLRDVVAEEQGDACLEVEVSHEAAEVQWLKQGILLQPGSKYQLQESGCRRTLTIRCLGPADRGTYRCETLHDRTQAKLSVEPRKVSILTPLADVETFEKETATFHLELSHPGVPGVWTRDGIRVKPSSMCRISTMGCGHSLTLERLSLEDSGTVTFTADTLRCSARLLVREPPVTMVRVPRDLGVPETGVASFECELSRPSAEVKWFKDGQELRPGPNCRIYSAGRRRVLQLSRCEMADAGIYTCDAGDCRASAMLHVQERQVRIVQDLQDAQVREGDNAIFTCEASHGDVKGEWFRDGEKIKVSSTVKIRQEGGGAGGLTPALPIRIVKPLRDKTVLARHKATLECTVSHARGRVRWLRGDTEIFAGDKYEICNLDCYRTLIIHRVGPEDEDSYTCDAFDDRSTARLLVEGEGAPGGGHDWGLVVPPCLAAEGHRGPVPTPHCLQRSEHWGGGSSLDMGPGVCAHLVRDTPFGCPTSSEDVAALPDTHCPRRELGARMHTDRRTPLLGYGDMLPPGCTDTNPSLLRPQGSALNTFSFSDMASSTPLSWGPIRRRGGGTARHSTQHPQGAQPSGTPPHPCPRRSPWLHTPGSERLFTVRPWPQQRLAHLQKRLKRGTAARRCRDGGAWQKHAVPGAAGPAGLCWGGPKQGGTPVQSCHHPTCLAVGKSWVTP
uniref:Obscurin like cytoskeletal adaptor 1 n=1 Tax=Otus sunia TaxID=257818 RepID=A0A8C8AP77_9STRI